MSQISFSGGDKLRKHLEEIAKQANSAKQVRVGFLEGATYPDGTPVAQVAAIQNYGAPEAGIPPRPFFSNMVKQQSPDWGEKLASILQANDYNGHLSLKLMGDRISGQLLDSIKATNTPPLAPSTIQQKGFSKPLVDTGHMENSISYEVDE